MGGKKDSYKIYECFFFFSLEGSRVLFNETNQREIKNVKVFLIYIYFITLHFYELKKPCFHISTSVLLILSCGLSQKELKPPLIQHVTSLWSNWLKLKHI